VKRSLTEDLLVARLAYERVEGSDGKGVGKATNDGIVVAAFKVLSHFDVQREYNPGTGERSNVISENTVDRPWFERQFVRVDWSKNLSTDNYEFDTISMMGAFGVTYEPLAYSVQDPSSEDAPHFDLDDGYLDITNKAFAKPQVVDLRMWGLGDVPACWLGVDWGGGGPSTQCTPVEVTIRQSFRRVKPSDYEPAEWDGNRFQAFGAFTEERHGYARNYGMTDTQWHRLINRYDIWERSHFYKDPAAMTGELACFTQQTTPAGADPHRDTDFNGTEDECEQAGRGSRCDTFTQRCTLPFTQRVAKVLPWYFTTGSNQEFFEPTRDATHEWDVALRSAVLTAKYTECVRTATPNCQQAFPVYFGQQDENEDAIALAREVDDCRDGRAYAGQDCQGLADKLGQDRGYSAGVIALAKLPQMVVLCHSPVEARDPEACGTSRLPPNLTALDCEKARASNDTVLRATCNNALNVRMGDLRFHQVNAIKTPQTPSPWGIMTDAVDPLTGESISASINVWTHVNDLWSQGIVDTARYIKGELTTSDVTEGSFVKDWAAAAEAASGKGSLPGLTADQLTETVANFAGVDAQTLKALGGLKDKPELQARVAALNRQAMYVRADALAPSSNKPLYETRRKSAWGTLTEAELTTKMMQSFASVGSGVDSQTSLALSSPLRAANPLLEREITHRRELALSERGACVMNEAPAPFAIVDLSTQLEQKFGQFNKAQSKDQQLERAEKMRRYLAYKAHYAVIAHEMGHSMGLRHNFVSSSDAFNYRPQYWQLRTDNGAAQTECGTLTPDGSCVGPRYFDPINANEKRNLLGMFMQSSVMDYAGEATQDLVGLGAYDFAATRMFYGDVAAVAADNTYRQGTPRGLGMLEKLDNFGGILGFRPSIGAGGTNSTNIHYSQLNLSYQLIKDCREVNAAQYKPAGWNTQALGEWSPLLDGLIVQVNGKHTRCKQQPVDYVAWNQLRNATSSEVSFTRSTHAIDERRRVRFPYGFATDRWADLGNLSVYRHDNGADPYELFDFLMTQQEVNHIFDNYRRNRTTFSVRQAAARTLNRYNAKIRDAAKGLGLMANIYRDFAADVGYDFNALWPMVAETSFSENILASGIAFDHFARQLARPEAGDHFLQASSVETAAPTLRSAADVLATAGATAVVIPNGATGFFGNVSPGGRPLENALAEGKGEYDSEYTVNAGSYYDKAFTAMLMTESEDNFISDSRRDFLDARYRSVSMADLFSDGYRRWLGNNLTGDTFVKGMRIATTGGGTPVVDTQKFPSQGLGWTSWWKPSVQSCFQHADTLQCGAQPAQSVPLDPQVGWEQQKFLIAFTLNYLPANQQQQWMNQLALWELGRDTDPEFDNRIEFHSPTGRTYVAKTFGKETVFGKTVQKGVSARMLEWANELLNAAYETNPGPDRDVDGKPDWYELKLTNGQPRVKYDPNVQWINGQLPSSGREGCNSTSNASCTCESNRACLELSRFESVPSFMRQAWHDYGMDLWMK